MSHISAPLLWRYATGSLGSPRRVALRQHVATCEVCRRNLRRAVLAQRALAGGVDAPSTLELAAWQEEVLARALPRTPAWRWRLWAPAAAVLALGVSALVVRHDDVALVARSNEATPELTLRLLCVQPAPGGEATVIDSRRCSRDSYLKVLAGGSVPAERRLAVLLVEDGDVAFLYPSKAGEPLLELPPRATPLPGSWPLARLRGDSARVVAVAVARETLAHDDPLVAWARAAAAGVHEVAGGIAVVDTLSIVAKGSP